MMKYPKIFLIVATMGLLAGCMSVMHRRIAAHQETWQRLSEQDRHRLQRGHVLAGDTEDMVLIALGPPDKTISLTSLTGQAQTAWLYDLFWEETGASVSFNPDAIPHYSNREQTVVFRDGRVVEQHQIAAAEVERLPKLRVDATAANMLERLDLLVGLTPQQRVRAHEIFTEANEVLLGFSLEERPEKGRPIRVKMRADIRALLDAKQQAKYDAAPQYLGGGSTKRPKP